jgi:predicted PolB exonuclease-like 3'-5' exonuclease
MIYILDIETKPDERYKDIMLDYSAKKPQDPHKKMATSPVYNKIFCIGIKELNKDAQFLDIEEFAKLMKKDREAKFITFNGKMFDIPTIIHKGIADILDLDYQTLMQMTRKYKNDRHIDLMEILLPYENLKKDAVVSVYLNKRPKEIDFKTCTDDELLAHCKEDLEDTEELYWLFEPICNFGG